MPGNTEDDKKTVRSFFNKVLIEKKKNWIKNSQLYSTPFALSN
jgi:hypothetical protein